MWPWMHFLDLQRLYILWTTGVTTAYSTLYFEIKSFLMICHYGQMQGQLV